MARRSQIVIASIYQDTDIVELAVTVSNGLFEGAANLYVAQNELEEVADTLRGFPTSPRDKREITMGAFEPKFAGGGLRLKFHCIDRAGHVQVEVTLQEAHTKFNFLQCVQLFAEVEPASVDDFVPQLIALSRNVSQEATLLFAHGVTRP